MGTRSSKVASANLNRGAVIAFRYNPLKKIDMRFIEYISFRCFGVFSIDKIDGLSYNNSNTDNSETEADVKKKRKSIHLMYISGLIIAAAALALVIFTSVISGNRILSVIYGDTDVSTDGEHTDDNSSMEQTTSKEDDVSVAVTTDYNENTDVGMMENINYEDVKAMWLSQFDLNSVYTANRAQRSQKNFENLMRVVLDNVKKNGINTVFVQMRPYADSMYPSEYYPPSKYASGAYGRDFSYDPIEIIVRMAHERELSVHAWINPMRGMLESEIGSVSDKYKIREWYDSAETRGKYVVTVDGRLYLNPAYEEVRALIVDGAAEIVKRYNVDGVHMDDYFYPTQAESFDSAAYGEYLRNNPRTSLSDFRKKSLNMLVSELYSAVKAVNEDALFGISPAGVIATVTEKQYADVYTWCANEGYVDYICPQVYFGLEHQTCDFKKICNVWSNIIKTDDVKLIVGMTLGKAKSKVDNYAGSGKNEWAQHNDILKRCLEYTKEVEHCTGVSYFCYQYFYDPVSGLEVTQTKNERNNFIPVLKDITWK